jgi:hypothetical protein
LISPVIATSESRTSTLEIAALAFLALVLSLSIHVLRRTAAQQP